MTSLDDYISSFEKYDLMIVNMLISSMIHSNLKGSD